MSDPDLIPLSNTLIALEGGEKKFISKIASRMREEIAKGEFDIQISCDFYGGTPEQVEAVLEGKIIDLQGFQYRDVVDAVAKQCGFSNEDAIRLSNPEVDEELKNQIFDHARKYKLPTPLAFCKDQTSNFVPNEQNMSQLLANIFASQILTNLADYFYARTQKTP